MDEFRPEWPTILHLCVLTTITYDDLFMARDYYRRLISLECQMQYTLSLKEIEILFKIQDILSLHLWSHMVKIGPLDLSSQQPKQAQFTWVHWWKLLLWIDLLSCYSLLLVYTWIYKYVYENTGMETFTINSCPVSDKWNLEYCKVASRLTQKTPFHNQQVPSQWYMKFRIL